MAIALYTERLHLRLVKKHDLEHIHAMNSLPETDEFNTLGIPENIEVTRAVLQGWMDEYRVKPSKTYTFVIEHKERRTFIGMIAIRLGKPNYKLGEVWYKLHVREWGKGYATEALKRIVEFGFVDLLLHRMEAGCAAQNIGSVKVLENAGFKREGMRRKTLPLKSGWADNYIYGILEDD